MSENKLCKQEEFDCCEESRGSYFTLTWRLMEVNEKWMLHHPVTTGHAIETGSAIYYDLCLTP